MNNLAADQIIKLVNELIAVSQCNFERRLLVISGGQHQTLHDATLILQHLKPTAVCWVGDDAPPGVNSLQATQATTALGSEIPLIVFNAWSGLHPDAFCALAGTLTGGGVMILLTPSLHRWSARADPDYARMIPYGYSVDDVRGHFLQRITRAFADSLPIVLWNADQQAPVFAPDCFTVKAQADGKGGLAVDEQDRALQVLCECMHQTPPEIVVITADRGRGKSALMGRLAARLLKQAPLRVIVTAARPAAVRQVLAWADHEKRNLGVTGEGPVFMAPDKLIAGGESADCLLIDEAAMLPLDLLKSLIDRFPRAVLASTVHGYEGTGRGLKLKLFPWLASRRQRWQSLPLVQPLRWRQQDPLEQWLSEVFCLADEVSEVIDLSADWQVLLIDQQTLAADPTLTHAVFGLLMTAHYRTTPSDLRDLLDGPNFQVWGLCIGDQIAGVCLIAEEGGFADAALCAQIMAGKRRPRGHLLPQVLAFHCHAPAMLGERCARIVRIAIAPALQGQGWGKRLLAEVESRLGAQGISLLGSSFALEPSVLRFWLHAGMQVLRVGATRESASGLPSCVVAKALPAFSGGQPTALAAEIVRLRDQCRTEFHAVAPRLFPGLPPEIFALLKVDVAAPRESQPCTQQRLQSLQARLQRFVVGALPFESALGALQQGWQKFGESGDIPNNGAGLTRAQVKQILFGQVPLKDIANAAALSGRDALLEALQSLFAVICSQNQRPLN